MNKIISVVKSVLPLAALALALVLIFTPIPVMTIQALIAMNFVFAVCLLAASFFKRVKQSPHFSEFALLYAVFNFELAIAAARIFLTARTLEGQIPLARIIGQWVCRENYVCGFFTMFVASVGILYFFKRGILRISEVAARFALDTSAQKKFAIDQQLVENKITNEEAEKLRIKLRDEMEVYSIRDSAAKFLGRTLCALFVLFFVVIAGGVALGILILNLPWQTALEQYIMLSCGYLVLFVAPLFLVALEFCGNGLEEI